MKPFQKSTKVNSDPNWTLRDYAEKTGVSYPYLCNLKNRREDFPRPVFIATHKNIKRGKDLFSVKALDEWFKAYRATETTGEQL